MRLKNVLVGLAAVTGIAAATVAGAGVSTADPAPAPATAATVGVLATNLGLNTEEARSVQYFLISRGYNPGTPDGQLGVSSWKAMQRYLRDYGYGYTGTIDGVVGANTIKALQRRLADGFGYSGDIDGKAGPATTAAFKRFANEWT
jgi:peptidoglycan hydrolase-like protein with peptidoglycan-binding domain